ncbi:MAG TPA: hypothetical protein VMT46_14055 [Anaerolineaceae bacterium]|nr:hypothetical protein [Anaerolineaceae bacterium]
MFINSLISIPVIRNISLPDPDQCMQAALEWIQYAHQVVSCQGVSKGYDLLRRSWAPPYPETTGYIIPTLLNAHSILSKVEYKDLAISLADFLLDQATSEGGVAHWRSNSVSKPVVFDTGQVIFGWLAAYQVSKDERYLKVAQKAGDWLVTIQDPSGAWIQNQHLNVTKVIDTRVAWALLELNRWMPEGDYRTAASHNLEWTLSQQDSDGWFSHCAFTEQEDPFTHTLAYTAEGLLESGLLLNESRYIDAARITIAALRDRVNPDGSLPGSFRRSWKPSSRSSCLTGNCQLAGLLLRMYDLDRQQKDRQVAEKAIGFVASTQILDKQSKNIYGGIAGSHPIYGRYERFKYPNWAAKFFIDSLCALIEDGDRKNLKYRG